MLEAGMKYAIQDKLYIWKKRRIKVENKQQNKNEMPPFIPRDETQAKLGASKLRDLAWSLDVLDLDKQSQNNKEQ